MRSTVSPWCLAILALAPLGAAAQPYASGTVQAGTARVAPDPAVYTSVVGPLREQHPLHGMPPHGPLPPYGAAQNVAPRAPLRLAPETAGPGSAKAPAASTDWSYYLTADLSGIGGSESNRTPEPSLAVHDQVVFTTGNWYAMRSVDAGRNPQLVDPVATFPSLSGGFCCDQVAVYEPSRDMMLWYLQYGADATGNSVRLAVSQGLQNQFQGSWYSYVFTPQQIGFPAGDWFDFPDIGFGTNNLYLTSNVFTAGGSFVASAVLRIPLDPLSTGAGFSFGYFTATDVACYKIAQGIGTTAYFATHPDNSSVRIARWDEGSGTVAWDNVGVAAFTGSGFTCPDPNSVDWCAFSDSRISSFWRSGPRGELGATWNAANDGTFPRSHVRVSIFRESDRALLTDTQVWSSTLTWLYSSAGVNARGDVAGTISYASDGGYVSMATWVSDDVSGHSFAPLSNYAAVGGAGSPSLQRWGDYFTTRAHSRFGNSWNTIAAAVKSGGAANPWYIWMGRNRDLPATPANDNCATPTAVTLVAGSTVPAPDDSSYAVFPASAEPAACSATSRTLWYRFVAPANGTVDIQTCGGTGLDTVLSVWPASSCPSGASAACNDDSCGSFQSRIPLLVVASGQTYMVMVGSYNGTNVSTGQYLGAPLTTSFTFTPCSTPATPAAGSNGPVCAGDTLNLSTAAVAGATYSWSGPNAFTSSSQNPSISSVTTAASGTYSVSVTVSGCTSAAGTTSAVVNAGAAAPVVTPPASVTIDQSLCCGAFGGATPATSAALATFVGAGAATDDCTASPTRLAAQVGGVDVASGSCFPSGTTSVTFRYRDSGGHVGTASASATVRMFGDLNRDNTVDPSDFVVLRAYFNFVVSPGTPPFSAPLGMADLNHDTTVDPSDLVIFRAYMNFVVSCLAP